MPPSEQEQAPVHSEPNLKCDATPEAIAGRRRQLSIDSLARSVAYIMAGIYASGFLLISLYDAQFGISDFSLLKAQALAAGLCLAAMVAVPALVGIRAFGVLGLRKWGGSYVKVEPGQEKYFNLIVIFWFYPGCVLLAGLAEIFFVGRPEFPFHVLFFGPGRFSWIILSANLVSVLILIAPLYFVDVIAKRFAARPARCALLGGLISLSWFIWGLRTADSISFDLSIWFYLISLGGAFFGHEIEKGARLHKIEWELIILVLVPITFGWFARNIYGNIKPAFGGGRPVTAQFDLYKRMPGFNDHRTVDVRIIEETDLGYYVVSPSGTKSAVFIPRSEIEFVELGRP